MATTWRTPPKRACSVHSRLAVEAHALRSELVQLAVIRLDALLPAEALAHGLALVVARLVLEDRLAVHDGLEVGLDLRAAFVAVARVVAADGERGAGEKQRQQRREQAA